MSGILFLRTKELEKIRLFYVDEIGAEIWQDQGDCVIFRHGNFLFGFCQRDEVDRECMLTFFYETRDEVDQYYQKFKDIAETEPSEHPQYNIYQFFATDPEGRKLEFQYFNARVSDYRVGDELLTTRRSVRKFTDENISQETMDRLFELCRYAPTSMNRQGYYFKIIRDKQIMQQLSEVRGASSSPIKNGKLAVAICADPSVTKRPEQDGCIAAYHFVLAAWELGLGTCWIAAMDESEVKRLLDIPADHYIATITPLGYPSRWPLKIPERKPAEEFIKT